MQIYSRYRNQEETNRAHEKREAFGKENGYEVYNWNTCNDCMNFMVDLHNPEYGGECQCMAQSGAYPGVVAHAVCNKFLSCKGEDINGRPVDPSQFPAWVHVKERFGKNKDKILLASDLRTYAVKDLIAVNLIRLFGIAPEKICEVIQEYMTHKENVA